jgi:hypothetical protein
MSQTANFASTPRSEVIQVSVANANRDGAGAIVGGFASGASGGRLDRIEIKALGTTTAGMVRIFKKYGAGAWQLWREYEVSAIVANGTTASFSARDLDIDDINPTGVQYGVSTHNAETFNVHFKGGDF